MEVKSVYELISLTDKTYYINSLSKSGLFKTNDKEIYLIDSGNDKDTGRKIDKHIKENDWILKGIINTHSNADHIGGNKLLQSRHSCDIISTGLENAFTKHPILEPSFLYGGYPFRAIRNKFIMAEASNPTSDIETAKIDGLSFVKLAGHYFDMIGVLTDDKVAFLGDSIFPENIISKYHIFFIYDVKGYLETLDMLTKLEADIYLPAHCEPMKDIDDLIKLNRNKIEEIVSYILKFCESPKIFEDILQHIFSVYSLVMDANQYILVGSTIKSYLSYMSEQSLLTYEFSGNRMYWKRI